VGDVKVDRAGVLMGEDLFFAGEPFFSDDGERFLLAPVFLAVLAFLSGGEARAGEDVCCIKWEVSGFFLAALSISRGRLD
jgi:hypothetical protein